MRALIGALLVSWAGLVPVVGAWAQNPPAAAQEAQPAAGAAVDSSRSLFDLEPNQFEFAARTTTIDGDPARFQRYGDFRDGVLFTAGRYTREGPGGAWSLHATADNVGWRDQKFAASYERPGRFQLSGMWDQIPQFYSVDTSTPYTTAGGALVLDDATQRAIQTGQATLSAYVPLAAQFDLRERRDIGDLRATFSPTPRLDVTGAYTTNRHVGELPWGASFGFSNDVEVALPYDSKTEDLRLGTEWSNSRNMLRVGYEGSWFDNQDDTLVWDSPLRLDDSTSAPGRGRMALWPSNVAHTMTVAGYTKMARRTQLTGAFSLGTRSNDEPLQPFTINPTLPQFALPAETAGAEARVLATNLNFVSRPTSQFSYAARLRHYGYDNQSPHLAIPQFINYDTSVKGSSTGGPEPYAHSRTTLAADATYTGLGPVALTFGYTHNGSSHEFRVYEDTGEQVLKVAADMVGSQFVTFRAAYEFADRSGSGLNEDLLRQIGEQPALRHYDIANRRRSQVTGQVDVTPNDIWILSANIGAGGDDYPDSGFGLQESTFFVIGAAADFLIPSGFGGGISYNYERYSGLQLSRSANPGQETDPLRDWSTDSEENVDYVSLHFAPPRIGGKTEARVSYDYSFANGSYLYTIPPGSPLTPPNQLPDVHNKLQQLHVDVRHPITPQLAATFSYLYEPFRVYDFAFDPSVVNGIAQPSSLVLGYVYRPYTAHSALFGLKYRW